MKSTQSTSAQNRWEQPTHEPTLSPEGGRSTDDIAKWRSLTASVCEIGQSEGHSKSDVARMIGMPTGSFSGWYSGNVGKGRLDNNNSKVEKWLASRSEMNEMAATIPESPPFVMTTMASEIINALIFAQALPGFVTITAESGLGKSAACKHFASTRSNVHMITMTSYTSKPHGVLKVLSKKLNVVQHDPAKLVDAIGERLEVTGNGTLLIVDEAQNLTIESMDLLRHYKDNYGCGVAVVGNDEVYSKFKRKYDSATSPQLKSRVSKRLRRTKPKAKDISMILDAWGVSDLDARQVLTGIAYKPGALRQVDETMKLASMIASIEGAEISAELIEAAFQNRDVEGI